MYENINTNRKLILFESFEAYIYRKHKYEYTNMKISIVIPIENIMRIKCITHDYLPVHAQV